MQLSRRSFLGNLGMGAGAAAVGFAWSGPLVDAAEAAALGLLPSSPQILLNSNENAYGPPERVLAAMRAAVPLCNRYPDLQDGELTERIAAFHKVKPEQVVRGNGSTDVLRMAAEAFTGPGKKLVMASPTFEAPGFYASARGAELVQVPLRKDFAHDLEAMLARVEAGTGLVYLCNPNNPTGSLTPRAEIEAFLRKLPAGVLVVLDEAYHHFVDAPGYQSFLDAPVSDERLIVTRTFSKAYGLAGMRLGYGISSPTVIRRLEPFQLLDANNMLAVSCGAVALEDGAGVAAAVKRNATTRGEFMKQAATRELHLISSQANFVMMDAGRPVKDVIGHFEKNNILIGRPFSPMDTWVRVSLGTPDEMREFWAVWDKLPPVQRQ